jgi:dTDP-4-amino-4,6-dideoxygalactose transaminase
MNVPFLDLKAQYKSIYNEVNLAIQEVLDNTAYAGGPFVREFEKNYAKYCDCEFAIGVSSGTSAIWLTLLAMSIGPGDEVITVPNTFIATVEAISFTGAKPIFVDVDEKTYNMDPQKLESAITTKTKAVIPVHLYGQMADMDPIIEIAKRHHLYVLEDGAQAQGAKYKGKKAGSLGDAGCFSFYPGKNLGAYGEAGAIVTNNRQIAERVKMLRDHGQPQKYYHDYIGWNSRMDGIQGAVLNVKLKYIDRWNKKRRDHATLYSHLLSGTDSIVLPFVPESAEPIFHIYAIRMKNRDAMLESLKENQVHCGIHYPISIHLTKAYQFLNLPRGSFPVAEQIADEELSLPMFPELTIDQIQYVVNALRKVI